MSSALRLGCAIALAAFSLAACDDGGGGGGSSSGGDPQDEISSTFADAFDADENAVPIDPVEGDAGDESLTGDPLDL